MAANHRCYETCGGNKLKRQAHHIHERQHKGRAIERMKDVKEVQRDLALIKSPAAGMKRANEDMELEQESDTEIDPSTPLKIKEISPTKKKQKVPQISVEIQQDVEMEEN